VSATKAHLEPLPAEVDEPRRFVDVFRRGFAITFALDVLVRALSVATVVVLIRGLDVSQYAFMTLFMSIAQFGGSAAMGGVRTRYLREEAERRSRGQHGGGLSFATALASSTVMTVGLGAAGLLLIWATGFGGDVVDSRLLAVYALGYALGFSALELSIAYYQARLRFLAAACLNVARAGSTLVLAVVVTAASQPLAWLGLWFAGGMLALGVGAALPIARRSWSWKRHFLASQAFLLAAEERWLSVYYLAAAAFVYVDVVVAGALLNQHDVATLGVAIRYLAIVLGAMPALGAILRVRTAQFDLVDSPLEQGRILWAWLRRASLPALVLFVLAEALVPFVLPWVNEGRYSASVPALQIYLVTALATYATAPGPSILMTQRRYARLALIYVAGMVVNLMGDVAVARHFGIVGIASVSATTFVAIDALILAAALAGTRVVSRRGIG